MSAQSKPEGHREPPSSDALPARQSPHPEALAEFFGSLAHDLRSPLGVVSQALLELRSDFAAQLSDDHRLLLGLADRGVRRLGRIADTVSLAAALDSGTLEIRRRSADLVELVREAGAAAISIEPRRDVTLAYELPEGACPAQVDAERLSRAVCEVVINAIRHARRNARLHLAVSPREARLAIEDDGQGVAAEWRPNLFRRFVPRPSRSGLGLGLSIAHDVIVAHGGGVTLEASSLPPGRPGTTGARFVISLPLDGGQ